MSPPLRRLVRLVWDVHVRLVWALHVWPYRLYRRRISVQLIASHVLVVILAAILIQVASVALLLGILPGFLETNDADFADFSLGEKARATAFLLGAEAIAEATTGGEGAAARAEIDAALQRVVRGGAIGQECDARTERWEPGMVLCGVARAFVVDPAGTIVASSDPGWAPVGQPVERVAFAPAVGATRRALALGSQPGPFDLPYVVDARDRITAAAYSVLADDGGLIGVVALQGTPLEMPDGAALRDIVWEYARSNVRYFWLVLIPALVVAIPVGVWRARAVARRLARVAAAADAMAAGDLSRRVDAAGQDEVGRLGERFNEMIERLAAADRSRKAFVANVSHELRTPVAIIQGHVERLLARDAVPVDRRAGASPQVALAEADDDAAALGAIHQETVTLSRLIDDLFTLARLEETALPLETGPVHLDGVAAQAVEGLRALAWNQRKVTVRSLLGPDLPPVLADRTRVRQILNNLLYNALRHTPEGGLIIVDGQARPEQGLVEVSVTDTGVGIPAEELANVFERFYRGEGGQRHQEGTGLGLHIVKQLVEAQRGTIRAESEPGRGTTFRFTLPLAS